MNLIANGSVRRYARWPAIGLLLFCGLLALSALRAAPAPEPNRFLFIIDTSAGMKRLELPLRETIFDLIYSGARGRMTNGDTFGVWLINDRNDTSYPMETWKQKFIVEIGAKAVSNLKDKGFKGAARLDLAMADLQRILQNVGDLTVVLLSNGETPIAGTPFDDAINARYRELAPVMKAARGSLNTTLVARDGTFVAWGVNSPDFLMDFPVVPAKAKRPAPSAVVVRTEVQPPTTAPAAPAPVPTVARVAANPIIITKESVATERKAFLNSISTTNTNPPAPVIAVVTPPVETNAAPAAVGTVTNLAATGPTNAAAAVVAQVTSPVPVTNVSAVVKLAAATNGEPVRKAETAPVVIAVPTPALPRASGTSLVMLGVAAGAGGALLVVVGVLFFGRMRRQEPSLISQAIARERGSTF